MSQGSQLNQIHSDNIDPTLPVWATLMDQFCLDGIPFLFILDFKLQSPIVIPLHEFPDGMIQFQIDENIFNADKAISKNDVWLKRQPVEFDIYKRGFDRVMKAIQLGDSYLLNLCYSTKLEGEIDLQEIYDKAIAPYKLMIKDQFVVFSPESFVMMEEGMIRTFPMKGTIDASLPEAENTLLEDVKEQQEHATVVDLLRNDLSMVAKKVTVNRYRFISRIHTADKTLLQCSSEISGIISDEYRDKPGSIMHAILPAGSVTGAPKKRTVEIIESIELESRGYYTGVFGVFDGSKLNSAVMIRFIEQREEGFYYRSGGGITYRSDVESEYREMLDKVYIPK